MRWRVWKRLLIIFILLTIVGSYRLKKNPPLFFLVYVSLFLYFYFFRKESARYSLVREEEKRLFHLFRAVLVRAVYLITFCVPFRIIDSLCRFGLSCSVLLRFVPIHFVPFCFILFVSYYYDRLISVGVCFGSNLFIFLPSCAVLFHLISIYYTTFCSVHADNTRGVSCCSGSPTEAQTYRDIEAVCAWARRHILREGEDGSGRNKVQVGGSPNFYLLSSFYIFFHSIFFYIRPKAQKQVSIQSIFLKNTSEMAAFVFITLGVGGEGGLLLVCTRAKDRTL